MAKHSTPKRKYIAELKTDILRLVANDESILSVARKMGINNSIIHTYRATEKKNKGGGKQTSALEKEVESLKRQLRQAEMEQEILKKLSPFSVPVGNRNRPKINLPIYPAGRSQLPCKIIM